MRRTEFKTLLNYSAGVQSSGGASGSNIGHADTADFATIATNAYGLLGSPNITVGTVTASHLIGNLAGVANAAVVASNVIGGGGGGSSQWTNSGTNLYVTGSNVGIGTTLPRAQLEIYRTISTPWAEQIRLQASDATDGDIFGSAVSINNDGSVLAIGSVFDDNYAGYNAGSVYVFTRTFGGTWVEQTRLEASDASSYGNFGSAVSINNDGTVLAIGATNDNSGGINAGSVYVFTRTVGGTWSEQTRLQASDASANDYLGTNSISINNDGTIIASGAFNKNSGTGYVYVFTRTIAGSWTEQTKLQASDASVGDNFGYSVSMNSDGTILAIGAWLDTNSGGAYAGSVYVFTQSNGNWTEQTRLQASDATENDCFGATIAINNDGTTLVIGAPYDYNSGGIAAGSVYVFIRTIGGIWAEQTRLQSSDATDFDFFGQSLSINNDGTTIAIGAGYDDNSDGSAAGSVYIFTKNIQGTWNEQTRLQASDASSGNTFGSWQISMNNDGSVLAIGSWNDDNSGGIDAGSVYVFTRTIGGTSMIINEYGNVGIGTASPRKALDIIGDTIISGNVGIGTVTPRQKLDVIGDIITTTNVGIGTVTPRAQLEIYRTISTPWAEQIRLQASDADNCDYFGRSIISINSDGTILAIGAAYDDNTGGTNAGSVYVFTRIAGGSWSEQTRLQASDGASDDTFGSSVVLNTDGTVLAIGAYFDDTSGGINSGSIYVFTRTAGGTWSEQTRLQASDAASDDHFGGNSISINNDGTIIATGSFNNTATGSVYVFTRTVGGSWIEQTKLQASDGNIFDYFGYSVSMNSDGTIIAIGAIFDTNSGGTDAGSVYVFTQSNGNWTEQTRLQASDANTGDCFGKTIAINNDGTTLVIGAPYDYNSGGLYAGSAYVFTRNLGGSWTEQTRLQASDAATGDSFGYSVTINYDGTTLAIGSIYDSNSGGNYAGSVYIFTRTAGGSWSEQTRLQASDATDNDYFGVVSINSDGTTLAIGAFYDDNSGGTNAGSVYVFTRSINRSDMLSIHDTNGVTSMIINEYGNVGIGTASPRKALDIIGNTIITGNVGIGTVTPRQKLDVIGTAIISENVGIGTTLPKGLFEVFTGTPWVEQIKLQPNDVTAYEYFGSSFSMNSDGTILVSGSPYHSLGLSSYVGAVYIHTRSIGGIWAEQTRLQASDGTDYQYFGGNISMNNDATILAISATGDNLSAGAVYIFTHSVGIWTEQTKLIASDGTNNDGFGNSISMNHDGTIIAIGAAIDDNSGGINAGSVYIFTQSGGIWTEQTRLQASDSTVDDRFGQSVTMNNTGTILAIGAYYDDNSGGTNAGSVYIFTQNGGVWVEQTRLQAADATDYDWFGNSIKMNNSGTTLAIGSPYHTILSENSAGSAYIFTQNGGVWTQQTRLQASDHAANDSFGSLISMNGDGTTLAVTAYYDDNSGGTDAGSVYIFTQDGGVWTEKIRLQASDAIASGAFGAWAISMNNDGTTLAIASSSYIDNYTGSVYVFTRSIETAMIINEYGNVGIGTASPRKALDIIGDTIISGNVGIGTTLPKGLLEIQANIDSISWEQQTRLQASDAYVCDWFGSSIAMNANATILAVGAPYHTNSGGSLAGNVYIYTRTLGGIWAEQTRLQASDATAYDYFGYSLSMNSDGTTLAIGVPYDTNSGGTQAGSVYIFTQSAGIWAEQTRLQASDASTNDVFGKDVSINTDGTIVAIGSAYDDNSGGINAGSVYIFTQSAGIWTQQTRLQASDAATDDSFGSSVSINNDGTALAIGAWYDENSGGIGAGSAYIFTQSAGVWTEQTRLQASDASSCDEFSISLSLSGDGTVLAVGADGKDYIGGYNIGAVYIFTQSGGIWTQQTRLQGSDGTSGDLFGSAVSMNNDGTVLAVGANTDYNSGGQYAGSVYIFTRTIGGTWSEQMHIRASDGYWYDYFGERVCINRDGTTIAIGTPRDDNSAGENAGSVYVFEKIIKKTSVIVDNQGKIGIGITNPSYQLQLSTDSAAKLTTTTWTVSSDRRIKEDIQNADLNRCYDVVKDLRLCRFKWDTRYMPQVSDQHMLGWIAQEVEPLIPNAISRTSNYGFPDLCGLDSDQIIKFMYGTIQKLIEKIEILENKLTNT